jgi:hypothetical protein
MWPSGGTITGNVPYFHSTKMLVFGKSQRYVSLPAFVSVNRDVMIATATMTTTITGRFCAHLDTFSSRVLSSLFAIALRLRQIFGAGSYVPPLFSMNFRSSSAP